MIQPVDNLDLNEEPGKISSIDTKQKIENTKKNQLKINLAMMFFGWRV